MTSENALTAILALVLAINLVRDVMIGFRARRRTLADARANRTPYRDPGEVEKEEMRGPTYRELRYRQALETIVEAGVHGIATAIAKTALKE